MGYFGFGFVLAMLLMSENVKKVRVKAEPDGQDSKPQNEIDFVSENIGSKRQGSSFGRLDPAAYQST